MSSVRSGQPHSGAEIRAAFRPRLVLASASPRRQQLLKEAGYEFIVHPPNIDEEALPPTLLPLELAKHLSFEKAKTVSLQYPNDVVLAADTVVAFGDRSLSKPADIEDARRMLGLLAGTTHVVVTGITLIRRETEQQQTRAVMSAVRMRSLTQSEIDDYIASGQWEGKSGGYGLQDDDPFVTRMTGSASNVVGLPMEVVAPMLAEYGIAPGKPPRQPETP